MKKHELVLLAVIVAAVLILYWPFVQAVIDTVVAFKFW